jgi:hypothetical protein
MLNKSSSVSSKKTQSFSSQATNSKDGDSTDSSDDSGQYTHAASQLPYHNHFSRNNNCKQSVSLLFCFASRFQIDLFDVQDSKVGIQNLAQMASVANQLAIPNSASLLHQDMYFPCESKGKKCLSKAGNNAFLPEFQHWT